jgi:hypothetical protein
MNEQNVNNSLQEKPSDVKMRSPFLRKLENFWYHYKWPFLIGLFCLVVLIICLVQCTRRQEYDIYVIYAGPTSLDQQDIADIKTALEPYVSDYNEDGEITIVVRNLLIYPRTMLEKMEGNGTDISYLANISYENTKIFDNEIQAGEAIICLLDRSLFDATVGSGAFIEQKFEGDAPDYAIYTTVEEKNEAGQILKRDAVFGYALSEMELYKKPGFKKLHKDTVFCVRKISTMQSLFGKKQAEQNHANNVEVFYAILKGEEDD